ncbi:MAG: ThuA domain-containing protein [Pirellulales bacterium]
MPADCRQRLLRCFTTTALALACFASAAGTLRAQDAPKKIVLIAGAKSHGPGHHEYELGMKLLRNCLDHSPNLTEPVETAVYLNGWPEDEAVLDDADTIVLFSDGADHNEADHPLLHGDRLDVLAKQMRRGCGLVALHYTVFVPNDRGGPQFLDWIGGYFDYQGGAPPQNWYSKIRTATTTPQPATPDHPILRGIEPFELREEYYYNLRFRENDTRRVPILTTSIPEEPQPHTVAWSVTREDGGRGFGFTGGHFHENWNVPAYRRMLLGAILWTAKVEVPQGGVDSTITRFDPSSATPIRTLIVTGHQHPAHDWEQTTVALEESLAGGDERFRVTVTRDVEDLARPELLGFDLVVLNYCNWQREGLSEAAKQNFVRYLSRGGGLAIIHFANGAFHRSLPEAAESDWPEFRTQIVRRVWDHSPDTSGHDTFGKFRVDVADPAHPVTQGMHPFTTQDELYYRQQGDAPIHALATARSQVTGEDEPMAMVYHYDLGRVFQTVLGHSPISIRQPGPAQLIRRGCIWAAGRMQQGPARPTTDDVASDAEPPLEVDAAAGRFGQALNPAGASIVAAVRGEYDSPPLTVECWTRLRSARGFNILVASSPKSSSRHWEIYSYAGDGEFSAYLPGFAPAEIKSGVAITDDRWHHVAMTFDGQQVTLLVDGKLARQVDVIQQRDDGAQGPLTFGDLVSQRIGCDGLVDEVRISRSIRQFDAVPEQPYRPDAETVGLWHFDELEGGRYADQSQLDNPALVHPVGAEPLPPTSYQPADPELKVVVLDRSRSESFLSVRADTAGRVFIGGREALFVYEPDEKGGYAARRELARFPADTWITDIEIRGDDLYAMTVAALYKLPGARRSQQPVEPVRLVWGPPVDLHVTYHGLAWGPQGDLYFSSGDPLLNYGDFQNRPDHWGHWNVYSQPDDRPNPYTGMGGFFRCRPDGSSFQAVAGGTRGTCGLAFDAQWNLFSNDNDHESLPGEYVPARLLHVAPQANFFWPRGWMTSKSPERADLLQTMFDGMGRGVPVGQTYYDESYLPEKYRRNLLIARWGQRRIDRYPVAARGASFQAEELPLLVGSDTVRPVGVAVGRGGRLFATISYMEANEGSPKYASDLVMITRSDDTADHPFDAYEAPDVPSEKLWQELSSDSWWRRQRAHVEILRRGGDLLDEATRRLARLTADTDDPAAAHLPWLTAASGSDDAAGLLSELATGGAAASSTDRPAGDVIRLQALRALDDTRKLNAPVDLFNRALADENPQIVHAALAALFEHASEPNWDTVARHASSRDTYLRQATTLLAARRAPDSVLESWCRADAPELRLAGVLACGFRLTVPPALGELPEAVPLTYESGNAHFTVQYFGGPVDLRQLGRVGSFTTATLWKHAPRTSGHEQLFRLLLARLRDKEPAVASQAAYFLWLLDDSRANPLVEQLRRGRLTQHLAAAPARSIETIWTVGPFDDGGRGLAAAHPPQSGPIDLAATYDSARQRLVWKTIRTGGDLTASLAATGPGSYYLYFRLQSFRPEPVAIHLDTDAQVQLWHNGQILPREAWELISLDAGSNDFLLRLASTTAQPHVALRYRAGEQVQASLPEKLGLGTLAERIRSGADAAQQESLQQFLTVDWQDAVAEGDAERGRKLFGADALGCVKCHAVLPGQSGGGAPSLAGASKRYTTAQLVESILLPSKQVAPVFRATSLATTSGEILSGLIVEENAENLVVLQPDATRRSIPLEEVEARQLQDVSPMPAGLVRTPEELGDILAYLLSENAQ